MIKAIKKVWTTYDPDRRAALKANRRERLMIKKDGTEGEKVLVDIQCDSCKGWFKTSEIEIDHCIPVGKQPPWPPTGDGSWDRYLLKQFFSGQENLSPKCKPCHRRKSALEKKAGAYK